MRTTAVLMLLLASFVLANAEEEIPESIEVDFACTYGGQDYTVKTTLNYQYWYYYCESIFLYNSDGALIDEYTSPEPDIFLGIYGEQPYLEDFTGNGETEVIIFTNGGGNDPLINLGLLVLRPTPAGFEELYASMFSAPLAEDLDDDGVMEIYTFSAYQPSFSLARAYRSSFIWDVWDSKGDEYSPADTADYEAFFREEIETRKSFYEERSWEILPEEQLRDGLAVLLLVTVAGFTEEYEIWWSEIEADLKQAVSEIENGDWSEVEEIFATPELCHSFLYDELW